MTSASAETTVAKPAKGPVIHPLWVRITHWINVLAILVMVTSGWRIYDASPIWHFTFPEGITLGRWLGGAIMWHLAAMWLLVINGLVYVTLGFVTGRFARKLVPIRPKDVIRDIGLALTFRLGHEDLSAYNAVQKLLYAGVLIAGVVVVLSGLSIWKPVQFQWLTAIFGGYDFARVVHFGAMSAIVAFVVIHVIVALLVPKSIKAMITGR